MKNLCDIELFYLLITKNLIMNTGKWLNRSIGITYYLL